MGLGDRLQHAFNAFRGKEMETNQFQPSYTYRPDRVRFNFGTERSIISAIYTRIAVDVAALTFQHARVNENGKFVESIDSGLNDCLNVEANLDQTGRALIQDLVMSLCDEGCVAVVPVDTSIDPKKGAFSIDSLRVGQIIQWYPDMVMVRLYNEHTGTKEDVIVPKKSTAIIENPLYAVMNEPNSTLRRLIHKLNILDAIDEQSGSGKLDLIIQLPYVIKTEARRKQAEMRRKDIEMQLEGSKYGIAYTDGTEHITQLNRPAENNLLEQVTYLTNMLYAQLGLTESIFNGTATEAEMLNYHNRTVEPIAAAITAEMTRSFLSKTARTQGQRVLFFRDPFKLAPVNQIAEIADKFTRNEILTSNEVRAIIGYKPSDDPRADELRNANINQDRGNNPQQEVVVEENLEEDG